MSANQLEIDNYTLCTEDRELILNSVWISQNASPSFSSSHFVILGSGSAAFSAALSASEIGARLTIIKLGPPLVELASMWDSSCRNDL